MMKNAHLRAGARRAAIPELIKPSLATLVDEAPAGDDWIHEIKFDGYRILAHIESGHVRLISRNALDWTHRFKAIAGELAKLKVKAAVLDGKVVAVNEKGVSGFGALQDALSTSGATGDLVYYAFDLLHLDGYDLRSCGLEERKAALARLMVAAPSRIHLSEHHGGDGPAFLKSACGMGKASCRSGARRRTRPGGPAAGSRPSACTARSLWSSAGRIPQGPGSDLGH
jgi:bifunctional non-homologous end joining protein LigD